MGELLKTIKQTPTLIKYFWEPFILAVFNAKPENINCKIFLDILKNGFSKKSFSNLVIPKVNLNELFIDDAINYFEKNNIKFIEKEKISKIFIKNNSVEYVMTESGKQIKSDFYVSAVSFFRFKELFEINDYNQYFKGRGNLHSSSIISLHLFFENEVPAELLKNNSFGMTGLIGTKVQWIFKRNSKHLSLVISASDFLDELTDEANDTIFNKCKNELNQCLNGFDKLTINDYKIIKEKRATFIPDNESITNRPDQKTDIHNFFIAGDWTNTGLPATIESAIKSSKIISNYF